MKRIIPVFFISIVLLVLGIILSIMWGIKGGAFAPSGLRFNPHVNSSFLADFTYFWGALIQNLGTGMGKVLLQILVIFPTAFVIGANCAAIGPAHLLTHQQPADPCRDPDGQREKHEKHSLIAFVTKRIGSGSDD